MCGCLTLSCCPLCPLGHCCILVGTAFSQRCCCQMVVWSLHTILTRPHTLETTPSDVSSTCVHDGHCCCRRSCQLLFATTASISATCGSNTQEGHSSRVTHVSAGLGQQGHARQISPLGQQLRQVHWPRGTQEQLSACRVSHQQDMRRIGYKFVRRPVRTAQQHSEGRRQGRQAGRQIVTAPLKVRTAVIQHHPLTRILTPGTAQRS